MAETIDGVPAAAGARPWESLDARAIPVVFRGNAREYYGIWIVNLLLTIVTLGIYSAWAKVRRVRYFRGNTFIGGDSFDYHAPPIAILKGRILVVIVLVGLNALTNFNPLFNLLWLVVLAGFPWLMNRSLRFNARYTSWRGVRFNFLGSYGGAFFAFIFMGSSPASASTRYCRFGRGRRGALSSTITASAAPDSIRRFLLDPSTWRFSSPWCFSLPPQQLSPAHLGSSPRCSATLRTRAAL